MLMIILTRIQGQIGGDRAGREDKGKKRMNERDCPGRMYGKFENAEKYG